MDIKLYASCKSQGCPHKFEAVGQPKGAPPPSKPKGEPVVLLTCPRCGVTQEIAVKAFTAPALVVEPAAEQSPKDPAPAGQTGAGDGGGQNPPADQ